MGGLGNQMFQYAVGLQLATLHKTILKLDLTFLLDRTPRENFTYRNFDLEVFNLRTEIATLAEVRRFRRLAEPASRTFLERVADKFTKRKYYLETHPAFEPRVLDLPDETYLEGYFQDERYFNDIKADVRKRFTLQPDETTLPSETRKIADEIRASQSVCLHVRRGDYVAYPANVRIFGICGTDYYERGTTELRQRTGAGRVFVFTDDVDWCRNNFKKSDGYTVVENAHAGSHASIHFWLMTLCRNFLIGNSSFAWWAAWLSGGKEKIVCRPDPWFVDPKYSEAVVCPDSWVKIRRGEPAVLE